MRKWLAEYAAPTAAALLVGIAVVVAFQLSRPAPPAVEVHPRVPPPTPTVVVYVHVDGAVRLPGVVTLPAGARVFEAIDAAGGAADDAELGGLNLASRVADGQKLVVPSGRLAQAGPEPEAPETGPPTSVARINLNTATQRMLETLPGVGPVTARRIVEHRESNGPFTRVEQLREARLVNAPTYERVRNLVSTE